MLWLPIFLTHYVIVGGVTKQSAKCDVCCEDGKVEKEERRHTLHAQTIFEIWEIEWGFSFYVVD